MLTTAKSIQLLDASGLNISPITDITSLYYEVANPNNNIVSRKYVYSGFPVSVNVNNSMDILVHTNPNNRIVDENNNDIIVSNISTSVIPGTTYRQINVTNYNLSELLTNYIDISIFNINYQNIIDRINVANTSIIDLETFANNISTGINATSMNLVDLIELSGSYIPNKFYIINDYYDGGCMDIPGYGNFSGPDERYKLLVKAVDASNLDYKLYNMYNNGNNSLNVIGTYIINNEEKKIRITYLKDKNENEAVYDFINLKYDSSLTFNNVTKYQNNKIYTDPFDNYRFVCFNGQKIVKNNFIGKNNFIQIFGESNDEVLNNNIGNNNIINFKNTKTTIFNNNVIINNNNLTSKYILEYYNNIIANNNTISINNENISATIRNSFIDSNNKLELSFVQEDTINNMIILNNSSLSFTPKNNIIIDNYQSTTTVPIDASSAYLMGQNIYAKSFNVLN